MANKKFQIFKSDFLRALIRESENHKGYLTPGMVAKNAGLKFPSGIVREAVKVLDNEGYIKVSYIADIDDDPDGGMHVTVTAKGWESDGEIKEKETPNKKESQDNIPAAGRVVTLNHNSKIVIEMKLNVSKASKAISGNNKFATAEPEEYEQAVAEIESGERLLKSKRVNVEIIKVGIYNTLKRLAEKFTNATLKRIINLAITAIAKYFDLPL